MEGGAKLEKEKKSGQREGEEEERVGSAPPIFSKGNVLKKSLLVKANIFVSYLALGCIVIAMCLRLFFIP